MKRLQMLVVLLGLYAIPARASDSGWSADAGWGDYESFKFHNSSTGFRADVDVTDAVKAFNLFVNSDNQLHHFSFGAFSKNDGRKSGSGVRSKYALNLPLMRGNRSLLASETSLAAGYLGGKYLMQGGSGSRLQFNQLLYGYSQYLSFRVALGKSQLGTKVGGQWSGAFQEDEYGTFNQWDNYGLRTGGFLKSPLLNRLSLLVEIDGTQKRYNPDRYFFVEKWTKEYELRSQLVWGLHGNLDIIPAFAYKKVDIERDQRADLVRAEYGGTFLVKNLLPWGASAFVRGIYAPWRHKKGEENLFSVGIRNEHLDAEIYRREIKDVYSNFALGEKIVGIQIAWKFGESGEKKVKSLEDYGYVAKRKYRFYLDNGIQDMASLTRSQQAERLKTLRKRNEWSGKNLAWKQAPYGGWGWRNADQAYAERGGDCDEQVCLNASMDALNGYKGYDLLWWDFGKSYVGHAAGLVQDPTNGQWFLDEYGILYKVNADPNASLEKVALEALKQNHRFTAMPLSTNSDHQYYYLEDCEDPNKIIRIGNWKIPAGAISPEQKRPQVEYGYELFTKRDFLFDY